MSAGERPSLDEVDGAIRDAEDTLLVVEAVLNVEPAALSPLLRDALASVLRLGRERARDARCGVEEMQKVGRWRGARGGCWLSGVDCERV